MTKKGPKYKVGDVYKLKKTIRGNGNSISKGSRVVIRNVYEKKHKDTYVDVEDEHGIIIYTSHKSLK